MRKSLARWSATLGLVGSTLLGSVFATDLPSLALPEEQVKQTLQDIPVFMVTNGEGTPLPLSLSIVTGQEEKNTPGLAVFFLSLEAAQNVADRVKTDSVNFLQEQLGTIDQRQDIEDKETVKQALQTRITEMQSLEARPLSLAKAYEVIKEIKLNQEEEDSSPFLFVPDLNQVQSAVALLQEQGKDVKKLGVPLFVAMQGEGEEQRYLTIRQDNEEVVPFFFDKEQLQQVVERSAAEDSQLSPDNITIDVFSLEFVIGQLDSSDQELWQKTVLWPSRESIDFIEQQN